MKDFRIETEVILAGKPLDVVDNNSSAIIEANTNFVEKSGLLVAKTLVDPKFGNFPIRIANFNSEPFKVYKNTVVACFESVTVHENSSPNKVSVCSSKEKIDTKNIEIPSHLTDLFERFSIHLKEGEKVKLKF